MWQANGLLGIHPDHHRSYGDSILLTRWTAVCYPPGDGVRG
jgi:hypothetical protein